MKDPLDLFLRVAHEHRDNAAVVETGDIVTYGELLIRTRRLAAAIKSAQNEPRVAIVLPKGTWAYATMFAALMAGGVYAPINLEYPHNRRQVIVTNFEPSVVVGATTHDLASLCLPEGCTRVAIEALGERELQHPASGDDLAYVMFTSGSTGEPKGVMIPRHALAHYVLWAQSCMQVSARDRWSQHPNIAFDLSVLDIYGALCSGATLYPLTSRRDRIFPAEAISRHGLTVWNSVPSVLDLMLRSQQLTSEHLKTLRLMTFCGEPLFEHHLDAIFAARPDLPVQNTYGPTEATVSVTAVSLNHSNMRAHCWGTVALGEPIPGMSILLEGGETHDEGEIVIAGPQVARGYWRDEERSSESFMSRPVNGTAQPAYKTGDWGKRVNGNLYFVSRIDRQIKRHGNRIELGDIDAALRRAGARAACTVFVDGQLISFVEGLAPGDVPPLYDQLRQSLPAYSIPDEIRGIDFMPTNLNDKVDSKALERIALSNRSR